MKFKHDWQTMPRESGNLRFHAKRVGDNPRKPICSIWSYIGPAQAEWLRTRYEAAGFRVTIKTIGAHNA